jgi:hypothetical protein
MSHQGEAFSEIVEIAKRNGDFRKNYGKIIGAYLYLRSISAARGRSIFWGGVAFAAFSGFVSWLEKEGWPKQLLP